MVLILFTFRVNDGTDFSTTKTVSITINAVNDIPIADTQSLSTNEDVALNITLTGSDIDNDPLTYSVVTAPTNGVLSGSVSNRTYTPNTNFNGSDSFTFRVNDGTIFSTTKTISITVNAVNDIPVANTQTLATNEDTALNITLTGSDTEGSPLTYAIVTNPLNGSITGTPPNIVFTPNLNYNGADSFSVRAYDGVAFSANYVINVQINGSGIITNSGVRTYFDGTYANSCNQYLNQASGNYTYTGATGTGTYMIKPDAGIATTYDVHCDMVSEGGGWTRVNSSIATAVTGSFNASQQMVVTNLPSNDCAPGSPSIRVNNVKVPFTKIRLDFIRASTVIQCPRIIAYGDLSVLNESSGYVDSVNMTPWAVCTWADNVWTKAPQGVLSISGLRTSWRIIGNKDPASTGYRFYSICSGAGDNGQITATWFVR